MIFPEDQNGTLASIRLSEIVMVVASQRLPEGKDVDPATNWQLMIGIKGPTNFNPIGLSEKVAKAVVQAFEDAMKEEAKDELRSV